MCRSSHAVRRQLHANWGLQCWPLHAAVEAPGCTAEWDYVRPLAHCKTRPVLITEKTADHVQGRPACRIATPMLHCLSTLECTSGMHSLGASRLQFSALTCNLHCVNGAAAAGASGSCWLWTPRMPATADSAPPQSPTGPRSQRLKHGHWPVCSGRSGQQQNAAAQVRARFEVCLPCGTCSRSTAMSRA